MKKPGIFLLLFACFVLMAHNIIPHHHDEPVAAFADAVCTDSDEEHAEDLCGHLFSHSVHPDDEYAGPNHQNSGVFFLKYSILFFTLQAESFSLKFSLQSFFSYFPDTGERITGIYELFSGGLRAPPVLQS